MTRDHYLAILGLDADATWDEVCTAYQDLCTVWNPARFSDEDRLSTKPEEKIAEIQQAYQILNHDSVLRARSAEEPDFSKAFQAPDTEDHDEAYNRRSEAITSHQSDGSNYTVYLLLSVVVLLLLFLAGFVAAIREPKDPTKTLDRLAEFESMLEEQEDIQNSAETPEQPESLPEEDQKNVVLPEPVPLVKEPPPPEDIPTEPSITEGQSVPEDEERTTLVITPRDFKDRDRLYTLQGKTDVEEGVKGYTPDFINASINCDESKIAAMLSDGEDVHQVDTTGETALTWAVRRRCASVVRVLLEHGAEVNVKSANGFTPYTWARLYRSKKIAKLLVAHGAKPKQGTYWWRYEDDERQLWLDRALKNACANRNCDLD